MGRRAWTLLALVVAIGGCGSSGETTSEPPTPPRAGAPNVVVLMSDDQDASMRAMPRTRRLLAGEGTTFTRFYTSYPLCCPSRTTFLTGQFAHNTGVQGNFPNEDGGGYLNLRDPERTLPAWLHAAGYYTVHIGKWAELPPGIPPGWDRWEATTQDTIAHYYDYSLNRPGGGTTDYGSEPRDYNTDVLTRRASRLIRSRQVSRRPFFLSVAYTAPHFGFGRDDAASRRCNGVPAEGLEAAQTAVPAPRDAGAYADAPLPRPPSFDEPDMRDKPRFLRRPPLSRSDIRDAVTDNRCRLASLIGVDRSVAAIVAALRASGELDNTLILYTSDNGFVLGEHREAAGKNLPYEEAIHVPLIVRGPGIPTGETVDDPTVNADLAPTILDAAGVTEPGDLARPVDGRSLLPLAAGDASWPQRAILIEGRNDAASTRDGYESISYQGVRTSGYLYVEWHRLRTDTAEAATAAPIGAGPVAGVELYDTSRDPYEIHNLDSDPDYAEVRTSLSAVLARLADCQGGDCEVSVEVPSPGS